MRAVVQRVSAARVDVEGDTVGAIDGGLAVLVCAMEGDDRPEAELLAQKLAKLRIFRDEAGRMNRSILDAGGAVLAISQFTLAADTRNGNRPGFSSAAPPEQGELLFDHFCECLADLGLTVETGLFGAHMDVHIVNDGPVTIWLDTDIWRGRG